MQANPYKTIEKRNVRFINNNCRHKILINNQLFQPTAASRVSPQDDNSLIAKFDILESTISVRMSKHTHNLLLYISSIYGKHYRPVAEIRQLPRRQFYFTTSMLARLANIKYVQVQATISYCSPPVKVCIDKCANPTNCISSRVKAG